MATTPRCNICHKKALYRVGDCFKTGAKGKLVCGSAVCWGFTTDGYPAEGRPIKTAAR